MDEKVPVSEIMTKQVVTLSPSQSLNDVERLFRDHKIRHIPVVEGNKILGIISRSDLLKSSITELGDDEDSVESVIFDMFSITQVMTKNPTVVNVDTTIKETATIISQESFNALPVLDNGELVGIVTTTDLIKYLLKQYP